MVRFPTVKRFTFCQLTVIPFRRTKLDAPRVSSVCRHEPSLPKLRSLR